jgi:zinc/manganese transport system substrate-binding protein
VPGYLLADADLDEKTPPGFARAIEDGVDPGAADTVAMRQLVTDHDINLLLYNVQTVTPVTTQMRSLAKQHGIPVVGMSETMPAGVSTYQHWQLRQLDDLLHALQKSRNP